MIKYLTPATLWGERERKEFGVRASRASERTGKTDGRQLWQDFHMGEGDRKREEYLGLFSAELQPLLDWVLWEEMEKLSSQVLISDQSLQSRPTAKLLYPGSQGHSE